jgi:hypothetical protein
MTFEQDLQRALKPRPAPPDLADRVLARLATEPAAARDGQRPAPAARIPGRATMTRWLAAAAAVTLLAAGSARYYEYRQAAAEAERVQQELQLALQITTETLARVQQRLDSSLTRAGDAPARPDR